MKPFLKVIEHLIVTAFCVLMFYLSLKNVDFNRGMGDTHAVLDWLPIWAIMVIFPYVFGSMAFRHFIYAIMPNLRPNDNAEIANALDEFEKEEVGY
jgi:TRAP-type C4-dicarboxylate transport system permease small subunit